MSTAILLITHENIAQHIVDTATNILNAPIENIATLEVPMESSVEKIQGIASQQAAEMNTDEGLLILTDLIGSTPFNVSNVIKTEYPGAIVVSGLNLPMLLKISNYRLLALNELAEKAVSGGQSGITLHD